MNNELERAGTMPADNILDGIDDMDDYAWYADLLTDTKDSEE
jgi:hypothetical protein